MQAVAYRLSASTGIHKGDRQYQQDQIGLLSHARAKGCVLAIVADGMGGRSGGRKASDQVMLTAKQLFERYDPATDNCRLFLQEVVDQAHLVIRLTAVSAEQEPHSTVAAFVLNPQGDCHWIHCGDSRIYHYHKQALVKRTLDHSYVQMLVERGDIKPEEADDHPKSNILLACLGADEEPKASYHCVNQLQVGDCLMACSDGLWHYFSEHELGQVLDSLAPREATEFLVEKARVRARGGGDNLSLVIVKIEPPITDAKPAG